MCSPDELDFEHACNSGNLTLDQEDIHVVGNAVDYTGTINKSLGDVMNNALLNKLDGTRAALEGERLGLFTRRGNKAQCSRQRQHLEFIQLKKDD